MSMAAERPAADAGDIREVGGQRGARDSLGLGTATALILAGHGGTRISVPAEGMETR